MGETERRTALSAAAGRTDGPGTLADICLHVAEGEYRDLDPSVVRGNLAGLSQRVRDAMEHDGHAPWRAVEQVLGREEGLCGDQREYDHPDNSYLNRVLERRRGLPILLSVVWVEVARGAGVPASGVGLPGHFIAQIGDGDQRMLVDPFDGGAPISREQAYRRAAAAVGRPDARDPQWLAPAGPRSLATRVLANLVNSYTARDDDPRLLRVLSDQLALHPADAGLLARRGETRLRYGDREGALDDLNHALRLLPAGPLFARVYDIARRAASHRVSEN